MSVQEDRAEVQTILEELGHLATGYSLEDLRNGSWLANFVGDALCKYAREVDREVFRRQYPMLSPEEIIDRRVERAKRHAAIEGALSAGAYTAAVAATIGSGGAASAITLPAGVVAFVTDLLFTTSLQLRLAYDISVLSSHPVDLDDPDELRDLLRVALGEKLEGGIDSRGEDLAVGTSRAVRSVKRGTVEVSKRTLSIVGQRLLHRALVKLTVPAAAIPLSSALNYYTTGQTAKKARQVFRARAKVVEEAPAMAAAGAEEPRLLLAAMWVVVQADREAGHEESRLLEEVAECLEAQGAGEEAGDMLTVLCEVTEDDVLRRLEKAPVMVREGIYEAVCKAATIDHDLGRRVKSVLRRLAKACGVPYSPKAIGT